MLNASDYIVGASTHVLDPSDYWHLVLKPGVKDVGEVSNPNITAILELKPDLVIAPLRIGTKEVAKGLEEKLAPYGIAVVRIDDYTDPRHGPYNVLMLGLIFDRQEEALKYVEWVNKVLGILNERLKGLRDEDKLTVFAMHHLHVKATDNTTLPGYGPGAQGYTVTVLAGLRPVTHHFVSTAYPRVTPKWVRDRNPDVIAIMGIESNLSLSVWIEEYEFHLESFNGTTAVAKGRFILLPHILDSGPGFPVAALYIAKIAYPDRFKDVDPNQYLCEFLQLVKLPCKGVWGYAGPNNPILGWK